MTNENTVIGDVVDKTQSVLANRQPSGMERAEIESAIATAKEYPRSMEQFKQNLLAMATLDRHTAAQCFYSIPRGNKRIEGPSIRLAEMAMICFQNIAVDGDIVGEDNERVYAIGTCRDLENNVLVRQKVSRRILDSNGRRFNSDMINVTQMAAVSVAMRNAITRIVPLSILKPILASCKALAVGKAKDFLDRRTETLDKLVKMGAEVVDILDSLDKTSVEDIDGSDLQHLIGIGTAIYEGNLQIQNAFPKSETPAEPLDVEPIGDTVGKAIEELEIGKTDETDPPADTAHAKKIRVQAANIKAEEKATAKKTQKKAVKKSAKKKSTKSNLFGG